MFRAAMKAAIGIISLLLSPADRAAEADRREASRHPFWAIPLWSPLSQFASGLPSKQAYELDEDGIGVSTPQGRCSVGKALDRISRDQEDAPSMSKGDKQ